MMEPQHKNRNWYVHLKGAKDICAILDFGSSRETQVQTHEDRSIRRFLGLSLRFVRAACDCAADDGSTIVMGSYWAFDGGCWEYESDDTLTSVDNNVLTELRRSWCAMLDVQMSVSEFRQAKQAGISVGEREQTYQSLVNRLIVWRANAPECLQLLSQVNGENIQPYKYLEIIEQVASVEVFEMATHLYLHKVTTSHRPDRHVDKALIERLVCRILFLAERFSSDARQLAWNWPIFVAGRETQDRHQQIFVRRRMQNLQQFGCKVCSMLYVVFKSRGQIYSLYIGLPEYGKGPGNLGEIMASDER